MKNSFCFRLTVLNCLFILFSVLGSVVILSSCEKEDNSTLTSPGTKTTSDSELQERLQAYFGIKNALYMGKADVTDFAAAWTDQDKASALAERITYCRDQLARMQFGYTAYEATFDIENVTTRTDSQMVTCVEKYALTTNDPDPANPGQFIITGGEDEYQILFVRTSDNQWLVASDICLNIDPYYVNMEVLAASNVGSIEEEEIILPRYSYNASAAKSYAETYWSNYNPAYANCNCCGGDCMNYVSQCLKAGGWTTNTSWNYGSTCTGSKPAWINSTSWKNYALNSGRIYSTVYPDNGLYVGDVIQFDWTNNGSIDHTMMVTTRTTTNGIVKVYLTGHNTNYLNKISTYFSGTHYGRRVKPSAS